MNMIIIESWNKKMKVNNEKKKNKVRKTRVIIGSIALAVIALTGILFYVTTSPRFIFGALLDKYYKGFSWALNNVSGNDFDINFATEPVIAKGSFNADIESADVEFVNQVSNFDFNYDIGLDLKNRKAEAGLGVSFSGAKLIDILAGYKDNQLLVALTGSQKVGKIYDKNLKMDLNDIESSIPFEMITSYIKAFRNSKMTTDDAQYIVKSIKDLINGSLSDVKFEEPVKETITIDGNEFNATKYLLVLNNENAKIILNYLVNGIINNEELLTKIAQYTSTPAKDIKQELTAYSDELAEDDTYVGSNATLAIYTTGSIFFKDIVKFSVLIDNEEVGYYINYNDKVIINANEFFWGQVRIEYVKGENEDNLKVIIADITFIEAKIRSLSSENIDLDLSINLADIGIFPIKVDLGVEVAYANKTWSGNVSIYAIGGDEEGGGTIDIKVPFSLTKVSDHEFALDFALNGNADVMGTKVLAKLSTKTTITNNVPVAALDATNAKYWYDLTDDEITSIINKTSSSLSGTTPGTLFESMKSGIIDELTEMTIGAIYNENGPISNDGTCSYYDSDDSQLSLKQFHYEELYTDGIRLYTYNKDNNLTKFTAPRRAFSDNQNKICTDYISTMMINGVCYMYSDGDHCEW